MSHGTGQENGPSALRWAVVADAGTFSGMRHDEPPIDGKILSGPDGLGTVTAEMVEQRAREIARTEERSYANDSDRRRARAELLGNTHEPHAPEAPGVLEEVTDREVPPDATGEWAPKRGFEDEETVGEQLVEEGIEEAEHERRVAALDERQR